jgi:hypothetical protein
LESPAELDKKAMKLIEKSAATKEANEKISTEIFACLHTTKLISSMGTVEAGEELAWYVQDAADHI